MGADLIVTIFRVDEATWKEKTRLPQEQVRSEAQQIINNLTPDEIKLIMTDSTIAENWFLEDVTSEWHDTHEKTGEILPMPEEVKTWLIDGIATVFQDWRNVATCPSATNPETIIVVRGGESWGDDPFDNFYNMNTVIALTPWVPALAEYLKASFDL